MFFGHRGSKRRHVECGGWHVRRRQLDHRNLHDQVTDVNRVLAALQPPHNTTTAIRGRVSTPFLDCSCLGSLSLEGANLCSLMFHCENAPDADAAAGRFHWSDIMLTPPVSPPKSKLQHEASTPGFGICVPMSCGTEDIGSEISLSLSPDSPSLVLVDEGKDEIIAALRARCGALEDEVLQLRERLAEHSVGLMDSLDLDRSSRLSKSCDDEEGEESTDNSNSAGPFAVTLSLSHVPTVSLTHSLNLVRNRLSNFVWLTCDAVVPLFCQILYR